jgi:hypothetical protein
VRQRQWAIIEAMYAAASYRYSRVFVAGYHSITSPFRLNLYLYLCLPILVTNLPLDFVVLFDGLEQCVMIH